MPKERPYGRFGEVIRAARGHRYTLQELGERIGYSSGPGAGVSMSRIERGEVRPEPERVAKLAEALSLQVADLEALLDRPQRVGPVAGVQLRRENQRNIQKLNERAERLQQEVDKRYASLNVVRKRVQDEVVAPLVGYAARLTDGREEILGAFNGLRMELPPGAAQADGELAQQLQAYRAGAATSLAGALAASAGAGTAGAGLGAGAALATYTAVGAWATASTGAAIAGLSGVAAQSATLAALGGGSVAAGGLGVAGGTAVLAGIVAAPALVAAGAALWVMGNKMAKQATTEAERVKAATEQFDRVEQRLHNSFALVSRAEAAHLGVSTRATLLKGKLGFDLAAREHAPASWNQLGEYQRRLLVRLAELAAVAAALLPLPVVANPDSGDAPKSSDAEFADEVEAQTERWNDAVLTQTEMWLADPELSGIPRDGR